MKCVLISQNPTGVLAGLLLEKAGHEVIIIDSGNNTFNNRNNLLEITAIPSEPSAFEALAQLEQALGISLVAGEKEAAPVYFDGNEPKPFLGFGESKFKSVAPLSLFNFSQSLALTQDLGAAVVRARELFLGKVLSYSEVAKVDFNEDRIESITLTSGQTIAADFFAFCDSPRATLNLIPADMVNSRWRSRILKTSLSGRVKIHFDHSQPICAPELLDRTLFLIPGGTTQEPFVGQVFSDANGTRSVWQAYLPEESAEEPETIASTIKHMRRQLQRAFNPEEFKRENLLVVDSEAFGEFSGVTATDSDGFLVLGSPLLSPFNGLMGCVDQARRIYLAATEPQEKRSKEPTILAESSATC